MATVLDDADAATARTTLGLGDAATGTIGTDVLAPNGDGSALTGITITSLETFRNRIINGVAPFINQRGAITGVANADYSADRWQYAFVSSAVCNSDIVASGGEDWIELDVTTADAAVAAGDYVGIQTNIEANNIADFKLGDAAAETVTLSFKHKHTKTGTHCVALTNSAYDRYYLIEYTQSVSGTEETHTETITLDTAGTWATGTDCGLRVRFAIMVGTDRHATAGAWATGNKWSTVSQVNNLDAIGNKFRIRDVQLEIGLAATDPEVLPYGMQLAQCQRYFQQGLVDYGSHVVFSGDVTSGNNYYGFVSFLTEMRAIPTVAATPRTESGFAATVGTLFSNAKGILESRAATSTTAAGYFFTRWTADAEL